jgi:hypothetical protein
MAISYPEPLAVHCETLAVHRRTFDGTPRDAELNFVDIRR